jgi:hypothetical protein
MLLLNSRPPNHFWTSRNRGSLCHHSDTAGMTTVGSSVQARAANYNVAAQTRIVSAGEFGAAHGKLSRHLKYIARVQIREFASSQPSQPVRSLLAMSRPKNYRDVSANLAEGEASLCNPNFRQSSGPGTLGASLCSRNPLRSRREGMSQNS